MDKNCPMKNYKKYCYIYIRIFHILNYDRLDPSLLKLNGKCVLRLKKAFECK